MREGDLYIYRQMQQVNSMNVIAAEQGNAMPQSKVILSM